MSVQAEKRLDQFYKLFMGVMISTCLFFLMRLVNTVDKNVEDVEVLKIVTAVMQSDITILKNK